MDVCLQWGFGRAGIIVEGSSGLLREQTVYYWAFLESKEPREVCKGIFGAQARGMFLFQKADTTG